VDNRRKWQLKKEVGVGEVLGLCCTAYAVFYAFVEVKVSQHDQVAFQSRQANVDRAQDDARKEYQSRVDRALEIIDSKLDRLIAK
jgi:hypothetical protein